MNDVIRLACEQAARSFGSLTQFNAACFAQRMAKISGMTGTLDGRYVRAILAGREDVAVLPGGSHYEMRELIKAKPCDPKSSRP